MRYITIILALTINSLFAQRLITNSYVTRMDSIGLSHWGLGAHINGQRTLISLQPSKWFKLTIKPSFNRSLISKMYTSKEMDNMSDNLSGEDYFNFGSYDVRLKIYINNKYRILSRVVLTGVKSNLYQYTTGIIMKF